MSSSILLFLFLFLLLLPPSTGTNSAFWEAATPVVLFKETVHYAFKAFFLIPMFMIANLQKNNTKFLHGCVNLCKVKIVKHILSMLISRYWVLKILQTQNRLQKVSNSFETLRLRNIVKNYGNVTKIYKVKKVNDMNKVFQNFQSFRLNNWNKLGLSCAKLQLELELATH